MLLKLLLLAIILYYVVKTARGLIRAMSRDNAGASLHERGSDPPGWNGGTASRSESLADVEDAKYVDI